LPNKKLQIRKRKYFFIGHKIVIGQNLIYSSNLIDRLFKINKKIK
jgi:hypothetical protein